MRRITRQLSREPRLALEVGRAEIRQKPCALRGLACSGGFAPGLAPVDLLGRKIRGELLE